MSRYLVHIIYQTPRIVFNVVNNSMASHFAFQFRFKEIFRATTAAVNVLTTFAFLCAVSPFGNEGLARVPLYYWTQCAHIIHFNFYIHNISLLVIIFPYCHNCVFT